ncbi:MAG: hypothetical protein J0H06_07375, partial [Actinobacteria bacterium]|nr:hypothetical protein [Actinomycetota bacterium]
MLSRRLGATFLAFALVLFLVGCGSGGSTTVAPPSREGLVRGGKLRIAEVEIDSRAVGRELPVSVVVPTGAPVGDRPLLVFLHGAGGSNESFLGN